MEAAGFLATRLLAATLLALTAYVLGRLALSRIGFDSTLESLVCATATGLGLLSLLLFVTGIFGGFHPPVLITLLLGIWVAAFPVWRLWLRPDGWKRPPAKILLGILVVAVAAAVLAPIWLLAFYPPRDWDDISYHLATAMDYVQQGGIHVTPYLRFPVFPQAMNLLFVPPLMFFDDVSAQLLSLLSYLLVAGLLFVWARKEGSRAAGLLAVSLWLASPGIIRFATTAHVDIALTLFVLAGAYALFRWLEDRSLAWLVLSGFLAGMAAGTKYTGLFFLGFYALAVVAVTRGAVRNKSVLLFAATAVAVALPWYLRNLLITGDPLFPMLSPWLGYSYWNAGDLAAQRAELLSHGPGHGVGDFVAIWWNLGWNQGLFHSESLVSLALVIPVPLLLILRWRSPRARILLTLAIAYVVLWFHGAQVMRYLFPLLPFFCLELGALADTALRRLFSGRRERWRGWATSVIVVFLLLPGIEYGRGESRTLGSLPVTGEQRERFLGGRLPDYPAYRLLNEKHGREYTLYALGGGRMAYYAEGEWMGDIFGPARASRIEARLGDGQALYDELRKLGADHFLISKRAGDVELPDDEAFHRHFRPLYQNERVRLFELVEKPDSSGGRPGRR